ncbi:MAG TPA: DoxX family membrane protein, partial [Dyella sp.]|uniref:DoxX family membrane protein n=1 Tax=Dyella sp. TaxID=1869338 RepID=UPI002F944237
EHADTASRLAGKDGIRYARRLFALSLPTIGLAHFIYLPQTVELVPSWLPFPAGWAWLTGAANILACLAILSGYQARLAATLEALMLSIITLLVWGPALVTRADRMSFTAFFISAAIALAAWIVAGTYRPETA